MGCHGQNLSAISRFPLVALVGCLWAGPAPGQVTLPGGRRLDQVDFERHVMGVLGRAGCNAASCHGSFQGKGGFRLSLFGHEPGKDHLAVAREAMGRRVNPADPDRSLLLLKPTGQVRHGGGVRFATGSWEYRVLRGWIAGGAARNRGAGQVAVLSLSEDEVAFARAGEERPVKVTARYPDGGREDVTPFCDFRTNDDAVAVVSNLGLVKALRPGSTAVVVTYLGNVRPLRVLVPAASPPGFRYPDVPERNYIDREVFARLRRLNVVPSELCGDSEFLRRVTIDTIGQLPSPAEVRAFAADKSALKRERKIDELLAHPLHAALWATKLCDVTGNDTRSLDRPYPLQPRASQAWHDWFRKRILENVPYDEIVRGVLCATSREGQTPEAWMKQVRTIDEQFVWGHDSDYAGRKTLDLYWRRRGPVTSEDWGERTAAAFLGIRLECARCHKHPFDRWTQADYRSYANVFGAVAVGSSPESATLIAAENAERRKGLDLNREFHQVREVFVAAEPKLLRDPDTGRPLPARAPGGPEIPFEKGKDPREELFRWFRRPDNPYFARSFVNRVWGHYFAVGIVQPVDDFSLANPPSNPRLLDALARDFVASKFDIRHLERAVLNSRAYQLSSKANASNRDDKVNFARGYLRPMMAEVVLDVLNSALGTKERWGQEARRGARAIEVGASDLSPFLLDNSMYALRRFGRPRRSTACDCERVTAPSVAQKLFLMTDPGVLRKLGHPAGRLQRLLLEEKKTDDEVLEELFLATLSRWPSAEERRAFREHRLKVPDRRALFTDTLWALINTREFILNH
jgi:hypothetical protein